MKAMILAAGRGERMRPLTDSVPKPLLMVKDKPLIVYHIEKLKEIGVTDIVINHAWLGSVIEETLGDGHTFGVNIQYSPEQAGGLETAGGIRHAIDKLGIDPFIVVNGDIYSEFDYKRFLDIELADAKGYLFLVENPPHNLKGDFSLKNGMIAMEPQYTFSGMAIYSPKAYDNIPDERMKLKPCFEKWISESKLRGELITDYWCDVGTPERLKDLDNRLRNN